MEENVLESRRSVKMMVQKSFSRMVWTPTLVCSLKFVQVLKQFMANEMMMKIPSKPAEKVFRNAHENQDEFCGQKMPCFSQSIKLL